MTSAPISIQSERLTARISTAGAELVRLTLDGVSELQWSGDPAVWKGRAPILFPNIGFMAGGSYRYAGRDYAMTKHGFARDMAFAVANQAQDAVALRLSATAETKAIYPFAFELDMVFALSGQTLTMTAIVANRGNVPMPASFGFHPAFRWPLPFGQPRAAHRIVFAEDEDAPIRRIDAGGLLTPGPQPSPVTGRTLALRDDLFVDDALIFDRLRSRSLHYGAADGPQLRIDFPDTPMLGIWTKPGAEFICIEPWHGLPDPEGFAGDIRDKPGIFIVEPGMAREISMAVTVEPDQRAIVA